METKRPTNPAAEEILGRYFPVLDHGFVALIDYMGSDEDVERAARVSYGYGTRRSQETRGLIRYLRRHRHTTPSEMVELKFHCAMPMFVARQWIRHRTACLAAGTKVIFDLPGALRGGGRQSFPLCIEEVFERLQPTQNRWRPDKQKDPWFRARRVQSMRLRHMNEDTLAIETTRIVDAYANGRKPVFRMTLADGKQIECTADHRFLFPDGWRTLHEAAGLEERGGLATWRSGAHFVYANGATVDVPALYQDPDWLNAEYNTRSRPLSLIAEACGVRTHTIRKWLRIHRLTKRNRIAQRMPPWNKGRRYRLGARESSVAWRLANQRSRAGAASNFWKGGMSSERESISRWTSQRTHVVHTRNGWTCQLCLERGSVLHVHHIVPVWADLSRARDDANLTTLCDRCHRDVHRDELAFVERLGGPPIRSEWRRRSRVGQNRLTVGRLVRIERFDYMGVKQTYDLEVAGPHHNFVANGIVTHNSLNEYSGRYSLIPQLFYTPAAEQLQAQSPSNRQGRSGDAMTALHPQAIERWARGRREAGETYEWLVAEDVARELARIDLPLSTYTQWYWKIDLHNLLHFLSLRADSHAQYEIQAYARVMAGMVKRVAPLSFEAWFDYEYGGAHLSRAELIALRELVQVSGDAVVGTGKRLPAEALAKLGLAKREADELRGKLAAAPAVDDFDLDVGHSCSAEEFAARLAEAVPRVDRA